MAAFRFGYDNLLLSLKSAELTQMFGFALLIARAYELFCVWSKFLADSSLFKLFCCFGILIAEVTDKVAGR